MYYVQKVNLFCTGTNLELMYISINID